MSRFVNIDDIEEGMILSEALTNSFGQTILPQDAVLNNNHKRTLKSWQITGVFVRSDNNEVNLEESLDPQKIKLAENKLKEKMNWSARNKFEDDLYNMAISYLAKNIKPDETN